MTLIILYKFSFVHSVNIRKIMDVFIDKDNGDGRKLGLCDSFV